jgi:hypothetical protein
LVAYHSEKYHIEVDLKPFDEVFKGCEKCEADRNRIIHSMWYPSEEGPMRFKLKLDVGKAQPPPELTTPEEIQAITNRIVGAAMALSALFYWNFPEQKKGND